MQFANRLSANASQGVQHSGTQTQGRERRVLCGGNQRLLQVDLRAVVRLGKRPVDSRKEALPGRRISSALSKRWR